MEVEVARRSVQIGQRLRTIQTKGIALLISSYFYMFNIILARDQEIIETYFILCSQYKKPIIQI